MKLANKLAVHKPVKYFDSLWSAPAWLKTNNKLNGNGILKGRGKLMLNTYSSIIY